MSAPRIYVDFNTANADDQGRVLVDQVPSLRAHDGMAVVLFDECMDVDTVLVQDRDWDGRLSWLGVPDWTTRRDLPP